MRTLQLTVVWLSLLALGCRANNSTVLLERDLRMQEDRIYQLQSCLDDAQLAREATIRENEVLKQELAEATSNPAAGRGPEIDSAAPGVELPGGEPPSRRREAPDLTPPTIELPGATDAPSDAAVPSDEQTIVVDSPPTQLVINKRLTGGLDRDGHDGDEGILVVFEPRDAAGHLVRWPGKVSVVAMDPALEGAAARVARWDFDANEVTNHYLNTVFGRGLQFELPWPSNPPAHRELVLFVRFTTEQGQKLTSDAKIEVQPPGDTAGFDRQTRRSPPSAHDDAAAQREPRSRLKARRPGGNAPRATRVPATTDSADAAFDGPTRWPIADTAAADDSAEPAVELQVDDEQAPLEASRANRPTWKPYR